MASWRDALPGSDSLLELPRMIRDPIRFLEDRYLRYGSVFKTRWVVPIVFLVGPEANKLIHVTRRTSFSYGGGYGEFAIGKIFERSLIVEDGEDHRRDREILQPAMGRMAIGGVLDDIAAIWERTAASIPEARPIDAYDFARDATFEVSANVLLSLGLDRDLDGYKPLFQALIDGATTSLAWRIPQSRFDRGLKARDALKTMLIPRIREARSKEPKGMLGLLAHHRGPDGQTVSEERIAEHLLLLFWAGYDTTATTGSWILYELARAPEWQERLYEEQRRVLTDRRLAMADLAALESHERVLKEVERLRPVVLFFPRRTTERIELDQGPIEKGALVFYSPYLTHRIPALFESPGVFDPDRWSRAPSNVLVGFGGGPRICLGKAFALLQLNVMMTTLIRRFRMRLDPSRTMSIVPIPTHRPKNARILFERRSV